MAASQTVRVIQSKLRVTAMKHMAFTYSGYHVINSQTKPLYYQCRYQYAISLKRTFFVNAMKLLTM